MKNSANKPKLVFIGRFNKSEILPGPEKFAKRISQKHSLTNDTIFIEYFFDGYIYGLKEKLFGKISENYENIIILRLGLFRLFFELFKLKPDIIHIITYERFAVICLLYKFFSYIKIIYESHGIIRYENKELKKVSSLYRLKDFICEKMFLSFADILIFKSENAKCICCKYYEINKSKAKIIPNGIDGEFSNVQKKVHAGKLKAVIYAGKTGAETGLKYLGAYLKKFKLNIEIYIIGENQPLLKLAEQTNINIEEKLDTKQYADFLAGSDIFLSINSYDTFSISIAEAMTAGCITIVTKQTGISAYIQNSINGFILNYFDIEGLNNCIANIINNQQLRSNIINKSRKIYNTLNWDSIYKIYKSLYSELK